MTKINLNECRLAKSGNIWLPEGVFSYAQYLMEPQLNKNGKGKPKYKGNLMIPPGANFNLVKEAIKKLSIANSDDKEKAAKLYNRFITNLFLDPNDLPKGGKPAGEKFEKWTLIRAASAYKPRFADAKGERIPDELIADQLYSGRYGCMSINVYWSKNEENPGVCFGLQDIQLTKHGENIGGGKPDTSGDFAQIEDDFGSESDADVDDMFD